MSNVKTTLRYSWSLFGRFLRTPSLIATLSFVAIYNVILQSPGLSYSLSTPGWVFESAPAAIFDLISNYAIAILFAVLWFVKIFINIIVSGQMYLASRSKKIDRAFFSPRIITSKVIWYGVCNILLFVFATLIFLTAWALGYYLWIYQNIDTTIFLGIFAALGYPLYVAWSGSASLISVLPVPTGTKTSAMRIVIGPSFSRIVYPFYFLRIGLELLLAFVVTVSIVRTVGSSMAAHIVGSLVLIAPLLLLRSATFARSVYALDTLAQLGYLFLPEEKQIE